MGKIVPTEIIKYDGGMQTDSRRKSPSGGRLIKNFDILSFPSKLRPYNSSESGNDTSAREVASFLYANGRLYGLGVKSGGSQPAVYYKDTFTDGTWTTPANNEGNAARNTTFFTFYKDAIYGAQGGTAFWKFAADGSGFTNTDLSVSYTNVSNGLVHSKDDILYVGHDNIVAKNNAGSWTAAALTLPTDYVITSLAEYGNFLAIACAPLSTRGRPVSRVFLWDRDSSLATLSESIDWGGGNLNVLEEYDGGLLGISELGNRLIIRYWSGGFLKIGERKHLEFIMYPGSSITLSKQKQKTNDRVYFMMDCAIDGSSSVHNQYGVWSVGKNSDGLFALSLDRTPNNDTTPNSIQGFFLATVSGVDYMFVAYTDSNGDEQVSKTNDSATVYSHTSTFTSQIFDISKVSDIKKLRRVTVMTEPFPTTQTSSSYTLSYRKDHETSYTTIFTSGLTTAGSFVIGNTYTILVVGSTDFTAIGASANTVGVRFTATGAGTGSGQAGDLMSHTAINIESSGAQLPDFQEIQFQITTTGGVVVTGFCFESEVLDKDI